MSVVPSGLVSVHVGQPEPGSEHDEHLRARAAERDRMGRRDLILQVPGDLDWHKHGLQPRWLGMESSDCPVAIQPGIFHSQGADERRRFLAGAARRAEPALLVSVIGDPDGDGIRSVLSSDDASVHVDDNAYTSVTGRRLRPDLSWSWRRTWARPTETSPCGCATDRRQRPGGRWSSAE